MRQLKALLATLVVICICGLGHADDSTKELSWSSVHLNGMHLRLISPKSKDQSIDLYFGNDHSLAIDSCPSENICTGPLTAWKIENNRLKIGYLPSEGDALVQFTDQKIALREPDGKIYLYAIIPK